MSRTLFYKDAATVRQNTDDTFQAHQRGVVALRNANPPRQTEQDLTGYSTERELTLTDRLVLMGERL